MQNGTCRTLRKPSPLSLICDRRCTRHETSCLSVLKSIVLSKQSFCLIYFLTVFLLMAHFFNCWWRTDKLMPPPPPPPSPPSWPLASPAWGSQLVACVTPLWLPIATGWGCWVTSSTLVHYAYITPHAPTWHYTLYIGVVGSLWYKYTYITPHAHIMTWHYTCIY